MTTLMTKSCECETRALLMALNVASGVVAKRSPKVVLQSILAVIDPEQGSYLVATDLEVGVRVRLIGARADRAFNVLLNPNRILPLLQRAESDSVEFQLTDDRLFVRGTGFKFELQTEAPDTYPTVPSALAGGYHELAAADLRRLIRTTKYATDPMSQGYALGGCLLEHDGGKPDRLAMVATDGRRLARAECQAEAHDGGGFTAAGKSTVLPLKALNLLERNLDDEDLPVKVTADQNSAYLTADRLTVWTRLVEGRFPDYAQAYPPPPKAKVTVKSGVLAGRVALASVAHSEETHGVDFTLADDCLTLKAAAADVGTGEVAMPLSYDGPAVSWTLDSRYVIDALTAVGQDVNLDLEVFDGNTAVAFRDAQWLGVMMPLTVGE